MPLKTFRKNNASIKVEKRQCIEQPHSFLDVLAIRLLVLTFSVSPLRFFERDFCPVSFLKRNSGHYHVVLEYLVGMATTCTNVCATCSYNLLHTMRRKEKKKGGGSLFLAFKQEQTNWHPCCRSYFDPKQVGKNLCPRVRIQSTLCSSEQKHGVPIIGLRRQKLTFLTMAKFSMITIK